MNSNKAHIKFSTILLFPSRGHRRSLPLHHHRYQHLVYGSDELTGRQAVLMISWEHRPALSAKFTQQTGHHHHLIGRWDCWEHLRLL